MSTHHKDNNTTTGTHLNETKALEWHDQKMEAAQLEARVFNMVLAGLALCILAVTGLYYLSVCYNRTRLSKRAALYESVVVGREQRKTSVAVRAVTRSTSFITVSLVKKTKKAQGNSISYIYSNPLPVGVEEEEATHGPCRLEKQTALCEPLTIQDYAKDPNSGVILDPPIFYMQL